MNTTYAKYKIYIQMLDDSKMVSSNTESITESITQEGVNIFYLVVNKKESDTAIFQHRFEYSPTTLRIPTQRLREAVRTLSDEITPTGSECQVIKRGDLPFILVWSEYLGAIAAITQYTKALQTSCQQILEFFETTYPSVVKEGGGDLIGHVPTIEHVKDILRPALLRKSLPPPPPGPVLVEQSASYFFSTSEQQIDQFLLFHSPSTSFQTFLELEKLESDQIKLILNSLQNNVVPFNELIEQFEIKPKSLARVLRHLNIFEIISIYSTPL